MVDEVARCCTIFGVEVAADAAHLAVLAEFAFLVCALEVMELAVAFIADPHLLLV